MYLKFLKFFLYLYIENEFELICIKVGNNVLLDIVD